MFRNFYSSNKILTLTNWENLATWLESNSATILVRVRTIWERWTLIVTSSKELWYLLVMHTLNVLPLRREARQDEMVSHFEAHVFQSIFRISPSCRPRTELLHFS